MKGSHGSDNPATDIRDTANAAPRLVFDARAEGFAARLKRLRVAAILDDFSYAEFSPECDLRQLSPGGWQSELAAIDPHLLLVESAWRGKERQWQGRIAKLDPELAGIIAWCRAHGIPTAFWNKEDPVHFETFRRVARQFDYVFTTDIDSIAAYQAELGHDRIFLLPFASQPRLTNPIERGPRKDAFSFAGGYYTRYPDRIRDFAEIIGALRRSGQVDIFDRGQGAEDERYRYPAEYEPMIVGTLPFERIDEAYKGYRYGLNFNSIKQSQSMFARRVFELIASNTVTLSNYSRGLRLAFGDLVIASDSGQAILDRLRDLTSDEAKIARHKLVALRKVLAEHTAEDRLAYIVSKVAGVPVPLLTPAMTMIGAASDDESARALIATYKRQHYAAKRLVLVWGGGAAPDTGDDPRCRIVSIADAESMRALDVCGEWGWLAPFHPDDYYGPDYLSDLALATRFAPGPVIGKAVHYARDPLGRIALQGGVAGYRLVDSVPARAGIIYTPAFSGSIAALLADLDDRRLKDAKALSIDPFSYCRDCAGDPAAAAAVDVVPMADAGLSLAMLNAAAEGIALIKTPLEKLRQIRGDRLATMFRSGPFITFASEGQGLRIESKLAPDEKRQRYAQRTFTLEELGVVDGTLRAHLVASGDLKLRAVFRFLDEAGEDIGGTWSDANRDVEIDLPEGTRAIRFGIPITGPGIGKIDALILDRRFLKPVTILSRGDCLILTDEFPDYDAPAAGSAAYAAAGAAQSSGRRPDVFRLSSGETATYHEFQGFECITGNEAVLSALIAGGSHNEVEVLVSDPGARAILARYAETIRRRA